MTEFDYDPTTKAIIVRQGDLLKWATFAEVDGEKEIVNPFGASQGDWLAWCIYDKENDQAILVRAELRSHYDERMMIPTGAAPVSWEDIARDLQRQLEELFDSAETAGEYQYWRGYEDAKGWAWLWFLLAIVALILLAMVLYFS